MEFLNHFDKVFTFYHMALLVGGTLAGLILGALPGLSPTMAVALMIPFTFHMQPAAGLILLGAMYTATVAGGAISAILVNVPGAPANIATALDGNQMAKQGRASEALHYCFTSSFIGGVLGIFVLIFFTPPLADLALKFGPTELFWIAILGITIIGTIGSDSVVKGLLAGVFGLALSTIGDNPMLGEQRFVFTEHLESGIHIVAALIGLFAIPQVFSLLEESRAKNDSTLNALGQSRLFKSIRYNIGRVRALTIGSVIGIVVGIIPGAGGQISGLVAYDQARKTSKTPENFGKGEPDGIIAAESANNAMVGPSLVPLLTLSIPGSPTAAVLLGGLLIHGLFPGPDLFTIHGEVTWTFINSLLVAQVLMLVFGLILSQHSGWIMKVPGHYMAGVIFILAAFGTYSIQSSYSDVLIMMSLGVMMYFASKFGFSAAPLVLGIILGPIAEDNFLQGTLIGQSGDGVFAYFTSGMINVVLILLCVLSILYSIYSEAKTNKRKRQWREDNKMSEQAKAGVSREIGAAVCAFVVAAVFLFFSTVDADAEVYLFPRIVSAFMMVLALFQCFKAFRAMQIDNQTRVVVDWVALFPGLVIGFVFVVLLEIVGFYTCSFLAFLAIISIYGKRRFLDPSALLYKLMVSAVFTLILYGLFWKLLYVRTPTGWFF